MRAQSHPSADSGMKSEKSTPDRSVASAWKDSLNSKRATSSRLSTARRDGPSTRPARAALVIHRGLLPQMSRRRERVNHLIRERLSEIVLRDLTDPRVRGLVTITDVEVSPDLSNARVFVSAMGSDEERAATLEGLKSATRFLQNGLDRLALKRTPVLEIVPDDTMERADRILRLIDDAVSDGAPAPVDDSSDLATP